MISEICGITPEARVLRRKICEYRSRDTTPSWMRAPPPSLIPMIGHPVLIAKSRILTIFCPYTSPRAPPNRVTSWENTHTGRPWMAPTPVITPSV